MSDGMTYVMIAVASGVVSFAIGWGMIRGKVADLDRRVTKNEENIGVMFDRSASLHETFVSNQHFNEIMNQIRDNQREFREDLKKVLDILTKR